MTPYSGRTREPEPDVEVSIVMPCLNEVRTLSECVSKAQAFLSEHSVPGEVIVSDNGSTDGSPSAARKTGATVVHVDVPGYGAALRGGIARARGRYIIMGDSDGSYDFGGLEPFITKLREGHDLVVGNRFAGRIQDDAMPFLHRYIGNPLLTAIGRLFFKSRCGDFYCGLRGFRRESFDQLQIRSTGMVFALEMVAKAAMFGHRVTEVPITLSPDGRDRPPHLRRWHDGWRSLRFYLLFSPKWLFWYPGLMLMFTGGAMGTVLIFTPLRIGTIVLDVHTLAYCAGMVVLGFQTVVFAVMSKVLAVRSGLHPQNREVERLLKRATLERGLLAGFLLGFIGLLGTGYAIFQWSASDFGNLDPSQTMRIVIPSLLALALGSQMVLGSFYLAFLQLGAWRNSGIGRTTN